VLAGRPAPLVAVREVGQGRTLAVATDASWYWGFVAAEEGLSARAHQRFWNNALRWLVRDPDLTPLQIQPDRPAVEPGEPVGLTISARGSDYGPGPGTKVGAQLVAEDGNVVARGEAVAGRDGTARIELLPPAPGAYKVVASASAPAAPASRRWARWRCGPPGPRTPTPRPGPSCCAPSPRRPAGSSPRCRGAGSRR
jgi:hypothetical protein